jgi:hypothetical protein
MEKLKTNRKKLDLQKEKQNIIHCKRFFHIKFNISESPNVSLSDEIINDLILTETLEKIG